MRRERSRLGLKLKAGILAGAIAGGAMLAPTLYATQEQNRAFDGHQNSQRLLMERINNIGKRRADKRRRA
jgi:hypothetical protein